MYVFAHMSILRRKRRGIQPQGIQNELREYQSGFISSDTPKDHLNSQASAKI
jgi:hypothetical protein